MGKINKGIWDYKSPTPVKLYIQLGRSTKVFGCIWYDDDDDMERTRAGPYAARSDLEHQVNHDAKITNCLPRFQIIRRRRANRRGQDEVVGRNFAY